MPGSEPATYKVTGLFDNASNFVPTGPSKNAALMAQCGRCGIRGKILHTRSHKQMSIHWKMLLKIHDDS